MSVERIDPALCTGCRLCIDTCPMDVFRLDTIVSDKGEFPSCRIACPAGVDMRSYLYLLKEGMVEEAVSVLRESLPLPAVTGRVCPHPCEFECARKAVDEAVNIHSLERFVGDYWLREKAMPVRKIYASKAAIVGSGPAGLACAYFLAGMGYPVTIYEAMPMLGGMLRLGIPEYRLPRDVLDAQISYIGDMGVEFKPGVVVGKDLSLENLEKEYQAIFVATGKQRSKKIALEGIELDGVFWGLEFLRDVNQKRQIVMKDRVVVIGGGNVAIDAALTARRIGAKDVQIACLESGEEMPAFPDGIEQVSDEGILIHNSWGPRRILGDDRGVAEIELARCESVFKAAGAFSPSLNENDTKRIKADVIILSIGQVPDLSFVPDNMKTAEGEAIQVDPVTLETNLPGIFAGGEVATNASAPSVVEAVADGKRASVSIDRYLRGEDLKTGRHLAPNQVRKPPKEGIARMPRQKAPLRPVNLRSGNFGEVVIGYDEDMANREVQRCMTCGSRAIIQYVADCQLCLYCERDCPEKAIFVSPERKISPLLAWG